MPPAAAELATQALAEEGKYKFPSFSASDALALVRLNFRSTRLYNGLMQCVTGRAYHSEKDLGHLRGTSKERDS